MNKLKQHKTELLDLRCMDCMELLKDLPDNSVDSIVSDPPYGLSNQPDMMEVLRHWMAGDDYKHKGKGFMSKSWDSFVPGPSVWKECLRVLKPGGHLLCFAGTRTQDMMGLAIRLAGFELRDSLVWAYGSGFPKSHDISKAIDREAGAEREVVGTAITGNAKQRTSSTGEFADGKHGGQQVIDITTPATEAAKQWEGWGSALKPAYEPIIMARKPLDGTLAQNTLKHGCGGINIDGCRVGTNGETPNGSGRGSKESIYAQVSNSSGNGGNVTPDTGRFPANLIHDNSEEVVACFPHSKSGAMLKSYAYTNNGFSLGAPAGETRQIHEANSGSAARFFKACPDNDLEDMEARRIIYYAKASKRDRDEGCEGLPVKRCSDGRASGLSSGMPEKALAPARNHHPTVKPTALMRYLVRLVTPPNGIVLDPFMGSGSTGKAAIREGFRFVGSEMEPEYFEIAKARINAAIERIKTETKQTTLAL